MGAYLSYALFPNFAKLGKTEPARAKNCKIFLKNAQKKQGFNLLFGTLFVFDI
jgi:hypothetical protein